MRAVVHTESGPSSVLQPGAGPRGPRPVARRGAGAPGVLRRQPDRLEVARHRHSAARRQEPEPGRRRDDRGGRRGRRPRAVGERVWVWEAAYNRAYGTAAEYTVVPARQAVPLGGASFELGAALAIPFMTAHRCLTVGEDLPDRLEPGTLTGRTVLVQGGAGAVGNAAIQLAKWADATVVATVSSPAKAQLAARGRRRPRHRLPHPGRRPRGPQDRPPRASTRWSR